MFLKRKIIVYLPHINNRDRVSHKLIYMPVKLRLQRHGKKGKPFYWIVAADTRAKRDGKFLEKLGSYNPNFNPAEIELNVDSALKWLEKGAQPTDTTRAILSNEGVFLKKHLAGGVKKGALTDEEAEKKYQDWITEKKAKIDAKKSGLKKEKDAIEAKALAAEKAANKARIAAAAEAEAAKTESAEAETAETETVEAEAAKTETAEAETAETETVEAKAAKTETAETETAETPQEIVDEISDSKSEEE